MSIFKKLVSILLAAVLVFSILPGTSVPVYAVDGDGWSMGATYRVTNILSGNTGTVGPILNFHAVNGHIAYCIDPTVAEGSGYSQYSSYWEAIKTYYPEQYELIVKAVYCGYPESIQANDTQIYNSLKGKYYERDSLRRQGYKYARAATQIVIFWIICGIIRQDGNGDLYWGVSSTNDLPFLVACLRTIGDCHVIDRGGFQFGEYYLL